MVFVNKPEGASRRLSGSRAARWAHQVVVLVRLVKKTCKSTQLSYVFFFSCPVLPLASASGDFFIDFRDFLGLGAQLRLRLHCARRPSIHAFIPAAAGPRLSKMLPIGGSGLRGGEHPRQVDFAHWAVAEYASPFVGEAASLDFVHRRGPGPRRSILYVIVFAGLTHLLPTRARFTLPYRSCYRNRWHPHLFCGRVALLAHPVSVKRLAEG